MLWGKGVQKIVIHGEQREICPRLHVPYHYLENSPKNIRELIG